MIKNLVFYIIPRIIKKIFLNRNIQKILMLLSLVLIISMIFIFFIGKEEEEKFLILQFKKMNNLVNIYINTFNEIDF